MNPQRSATLTAAFYPTVVVAGWAFVSLAGISSARIEDSATARAVDRLAPSLTASVEATAAPPQAIAAATPQAIAAATPQAIAAAIPQAIAAATPQAITMSNDVATMSYVAADTPEVAAAAELVASPITNTKPVTDATAAPAEPRPFVVAALTDPAEVLPAETPPVQTAAAGTADPLPQGTGTPAGRVEIVGECLVAEPCIDQYLFALYQRTPKEDTIKETEKRKVTIKRKGKLVTVTRSFTRLVDNDFTWKDPKAAERAGMSMTDYVIGGMDRKFKLKLFYMLQAAENAGLRPGITSAFRDDYRQSIASGLKAASDRSYHGGSSRGGYGHGLAADIVSVNGASRAQRWTSTEAFWKWVDANGKQFGVGRPYLDRDPPHVGPIDGQEYTSRRGGGGTKAADVKKRQKQAAQAKPAAAKRAVVARSSNSKPAGRLAEAR